MQDVPLEGNGRIHAGAKVVGKVVDVTSGTRQEIALRFYALKTRNGRIALSTDLRAMATTMDVEQAMIPTSGPDRGTSEADWVTEQIGGVRSITGALSRTDPKLSVIMSAVEYWPACLRKQGMVAAAMWGITVNRGRCGSFRPMRAACTTCPI